MPTTTNNKGAPIPVRPTPQMRQQIDELSAAGFGNQTEVIRTAVDRMHQQEKGRKAMKAYVFSKNRPSSLVIINGDVYGRTDTVTNDAVTVVFAPANDTADADLYAPVGKDYEVIYGPCEQSELPSFSLVETFNLFEVLDTDGQWYQVRRLGW